MSLLAQHEEALTALVRADEEARLAHAYVVEGPVEEGARLVQAFVTRLLERDAATSQERHSVARRIVTHAHPDVHWVKPEGKARIIKIDPIRELNRQIAHTPMEGKWKAGIVVQADRMKEHAANCFLKTLEEPPLNSLIFLLTDAPQFLQATIVSRCQRVVISRQGTVHESPWVTKAMTLLRADPPGHPVDALLAASRWKALMDEVKAHVEKEESAAEADSDETEDIREARIVSRVKEVRAEILQTITLWRRDVLMASLALPATQLNFAGDAGIIGRQAAGGSPAEALRALASVESMSRMFDRNLPELVVFERDHLQTLKTPVKA